MLPALECEEMDPLPQSLMPKKRGFFFGALFSFESPQTPKSFLRSIAIYPSSLSLQLFLVVENFASKVENFSFFTSFTLTYLLIYI
jgi:hypothetical protein